MKFSIRFADQIVGTLVILALAILVFVIFMLGKNQRWFVQDPRYITYFNSASGISTNMDVKYKGLTIGHVKEISLKGDRVEVTFSIFDEEQERVKEGSLVEVSVSPIGLGSSFNFYPGKGGPLTGNVIYEANSAEAKLLDPKIVDRPDSGDGIGKLISNVNLVLESINTISEGEESTVLSQILRNLESVTKEVSGVTQSLSGQINPILNNLQTVIDQVSDPSGTVMSILGSEGSLYTNLTSVIESLSGIVKNLEKTSEYIPEQLPQISVLINDINGVIETTKGVMTSIENNPLIKGGIPERRETGPGAASPRDIQF